MPRLLRRACLAVPVVAALGCTRDPAPVAEAPVPATASSSAGPAASDRHAEASFELHWGADGPLRVGQGGTLTVTLEARGGYKVNEDYPIKLKLDEAPGVGFASREVGKDRAVVTKQQAVLTVPLKPEQAGKRRATGTLSFSVCTEDKCLMERRALAVELDIQPGA